MEEYVPKVEEHEAGHATYARARASEGYLSMKIEGFVRQNSLDVFHHDLATFVNAHVRQWLDDMVDRTHFSVQLIEPGCHTGLRPNPR